MAVSGCCTHNGRCRREFQIRRFGFCEIDTACFTSFQWRLPPIVYIIYRTILALYTIFWLIETAIEFTHIYNIKHTLDREFQLHPWPVYLSNWAYLLLTVYLTLHAMISGFYICRRPKHVGICDRMSEADHASRIVYVGVPTSEYGAADDEDVTSDDGMKELQIVEMSTRNPLSCNKPLRCHFKLLWVLYNLVATLTIIVSIVFFGFLWPEFNKDGRSIDNMNLQMHGVTLLIIMVEIFVSAIPIRLLHVIYPLAFGAVYVIFSLIRFWAWSTDPIYPYLLDWRSDHMTGTILTISILAGVGIPLVQLLLFAVTVIKTAISSKLFQPYEVVQTDHTMA